MASAQSNSIVNVSRINNVPHLPDYKRFQTVIRNPENCNINDLSERDILALIDMSNMELLKIVPVHKLTTKVCDAYLARQLPPLSNMWKAFNDIQRIEACKDKRYLKLRDFSSLTNEEIDLVLSMDGTYLEAIKDPTEKHYRLASRSKVPHVNHNTPIQLVKEAINRGAIFNDLYSENKELRRYVIEHNPSSVWADLDNLSWREILALAERLENLTEPKVMKINTHIKVVSKYSSPNYDLSGLTFTTEDLSELIKISPRQIQVCDIDLDDQYYRDLTIKDLVGIIDKYPRVLCFMADDLIRIILTEPMLINNILSNNPYLYKELSSTILTELSRHLDIKQVLALLKKDFRCIVHMTPFLTDKQVRSLIFEQFQYLKDTELLSKISVKFCHNDWKDLFEMNLAVIACPNFDLPQDENLVDKLLKKNPQLTTFLRNDHLSYPDLLKILKEGFIPKECIISKDFHLAVRKNPAAWKSINPAAPITEDMVWTLNDRSSINFNVFIDIITRLNKDLKIPLSYASDVYGIYHVFGDRKNGVVREFITEIPAQRQTEELCLEFVTRFSVLRHCHVKTIKVIKAALQKDPKQIIDLDIQTPELCEYAFNLDNTVEKYIFDLSIVDAIKRTQA